MLAICIAAYAIDGDSIRCRNLGEVRLLGIDAADKTYSRPCVGGFGDHVCDDRLARAATVSLRAALKRGPVKVEGVGRDRYGRLLGVVTAGGTNLNCWQLRQRVVRYIAKYDNGGRIRAACPSLTR